MATHFTRLHDRVVDRLANFRHPANALLPFLQTTANGKTIPVVHEELENFLDKFNQALNTLTGVALIVLTPDADMIDPDAPTLDLRPRLVVEIRANPLINNGNNGAKVAAMALVLFVMRALQGWPHGVTAGSEIAQRMMLAKRPFIRIPNTEPLVIYHVDFNTELDLDAELAA
jgi:hypothetical protein